MTVDASFQIRKLPPSHITQLSLILEFSEQWKKLMAVIPDKLQKGNFNCCISCENPAKYNADHMRLIESASQKFRKSGTEILLDEWGCSGRILPTVGHLLHLLLSAELYRAADYVSEKILCRPSMKRPSLGPAAKVGVNKNGNIEDNLNDMKYSSTLIENMNFSSFNNNLDCSNEITCIPPIVITPDADELPQNAINETTSVVQNNINQCIPLISLLLSDTESGNENSVSHEVSSTQELNNESVSISSTLPDISQLDQSDSLIQNNNESPFGESNDESKDAIPNLSFLNQSETTYNSMESTEVSSSNLREFNESESGYDLIPNLSGLNQSVSSMNECNGNIKTSFKNIEKSEIPDHLPVCLTEISTSDEKQQKSTENNYSANFPDLSGLIQVSGEESFNKASTDSESAEIAHINSKYLSNTESNSTNYDNDVSMGNLNNLLPDSNKLTVSAFDSSKSRKCNSPLPNLTLMTHLPHYTYEKLKSSTNDFNEDNFVDCNRKGRLLGSGAFGKVFLAIGISQEPVAVKKIILGNIENVAVDDRVTRQFINEVEVLSRFQHKNLVSLLGFSCDGCTYCLLYEYISGGTLKDRLQSSDDKLTWQERLNIALGTAKAISYLHTAFSSPLIHRDVKTANILLDQSKNPKLGDFGITTLLDNHNMNTSTVIGTSAYMAPEAMRGDISVKCDTFSYGVVLLELLTSLPPFDESRDGQDLITHVEEKCEESIAALLDTSIGSWSMKDVHFGEELYAIATQCLEEKKRRPVMVDVTELLMINIVSKIAIF